MGHEGAGIVVDVGAGRNVGEERRSRDSAVHARMSPVQVLYVRKNQSVPGDPRDARQRRDARRHQPLLVQPQTAVPLHGYVDVLELHRAAGNRGGEDPRRRAVRQGLLHRLRRDDRHRRGDQHREGRSRCQRGGVRSRRHRSQRDSRRATGRRESHHRRRYEPVEEAARGEVRHDRLRQPEGSATISWPRSSR